VRGVDQAWTLWSERGCFEGHADNGLSCWPMATPRTLSDFLRQLEAAGELRRISETVSPLLTPAIAADREARAPAAVQSTYAHAFDPMHAHLGGQALLFERVEGCDVPLAMNVFGSYRRVERALGVEETGGIEAIAAHLAALLQPTPPQGMRAMLAKAKQLLPVLRMPPKLVSHGVCQELVQLTERDEVDVSRLPLIQCWPNDGNPEAVGWPMSAEQAGTAAGLGRYITFAGMHTIHARDRGSARPASHNIGMYRAQLLGPTSLAMHWHVHHDGASHWRSWKAIGERMPIAIAFGGEPCLPYAATAPLPPGLSELLMAGLLNGRGIPLVKCKTVPLRVPANAEIVIEGWVSTECGSPGWLPEQGEPIGPGAVLEGPFGDHTGFYSLPDRYPVMEVTAITRRHNAVFPATVVGPPPQEDYALGKATERIFKPLLQTLVPDIVDYHLPLPGCFHNMAVIGIHKQWAFQARRIMQSIWGAGQMAWTKCVVVVDADRVNVHDEEAVLREVFTHAHFGRDVVLTYGPLDILDHAATHLGAGGKLGIDATPFLDGEQAGTTCDRAPTPVDIETMRRAVAHLPAHVPDWGCGRCVVLQVSDERPGRGRSALGELKTVLGAFDGLAIALGPEVDITHRDQVWFHMLANVDPMGDQVQVHGGLGLDATPKREIDALPSRPVRAWPEVLPVR
jgi:4-hydroxy-3-polyprenylbenzoate decarboxylase